MKNALVYLRDAIKYKLKHAKTQQEKIVLSIQLTSVWGDTEAHQLAQSLKQVLELAGWQIKGVDQAAFANAVTGVCLETPTVRPALDVLGRWLAAAGLRPEGLRVKNATTVRLIVEGSQPSFSASWAKATMFGGGCAIQ